MPNDHDDYSRKFGGAALAARLRRLSERLDRDGTSIYAKNGILFEQRWYGILRQLLSNGPMTVGEIAAAIQISHASVSEARRSLEEAGIVASSPSTRDRRQRSLHLTPTGLALCERLAPLWEMFNAAAQELNDEVGDVVSLLDRLDDALARRSMYQRITDRTGRKNLDDP